MSDVDAATRDAIRAAVRAAIEPSWVTEDDTWDDVAGRITEAIAPVVAAALERVEAERDAALADAAQERNSSQSLVDTSVHYRNLAIRLGAQPTDMTNRWDRDLCEKWDGPGTAFEGATQTESVDRSRAEWREIWEDDEKLTAVPRWLCDYKLVTTLIEYEADTPTREADNG